MAAHLFPASSVGWSIFQVGDEFGDFLQLTLQHALLPRIILCLARRHNSCKKIAQNISIISTCICRVLFYVSARCHNFYQQMCKSCIKIMYRDRLASSVADPDTCTCLSIPLCVPVCLSPCVYLSVYPPVCTCLSIPGPACSDRHFPRLPLPQAQVQRQVSQSDGGVGSAHQLKQSTTSIPLQSQSTTSIPLKKVNQLHQFHSKKPINCINSTQKAVIIFTNNIRSQQICLVSGLIYKKVFNPNSESRSDSICFQLWL